MSCGCRGTFAEMQSASAARSVLLTEVVEKISLAGEELTSSPGANHDARRETRTPAARRAIHDLGGCHPPRSKHPEVFHSRHVQPSRFRKVPHPAHTLAPIHGDHGNPRSDGAAHMD